MQRSLLRVMPVFLVLAVAAGLAGLCLWGGFGAEQPPAQDDGAGGWQAADDRSAASASEGAQVGVQGGASVGAMQGDGQGDVQGEQRGGVQGDDQGEQRGGLLPEAQGSAGCPLPLPASAFGLSYQKGLLTESWKAYSTQPCKEVARELLEQLRREGVTLLEAGTMDVSGEAWGCTVKSSQDEALTLTLVPERLGRQRGADNRLCITVVRINQPSFI